MDKADSTSLKNFSKLKSSADFCLECGDMLTLPIYSDFVECPKCGFKVSILDYPIEEIVTHKEYTEKKPWLERYNQKLRRGLNPETLKMDNDDEEIEKPTEFRQTIDQECPKCAHKKMYYTAMQMRSADEGQTIIYKCVKCE